MSELFNYGCSAAGVFYIGYTGNVGSDVEEKLNSFADLPDYGSGGPIPQSQIATALAWNNFLRARGFLETDASPGTDGEVAIGGRLGEHYVEVIIEPDNTISVAYDRNRKQIFYKLRQPPWQAQRLLQKLTDEIWSASTSFIATNTTPQQISGLGRLSATGRLATTNTAEGFFGNSKRSLDGTHHHVSRKYLPFYLAELDYKYNTREMTDGARTANAIPKLVGKRLMLRRPKGHS